MVVMNLSTGQQWRCRHGERTFGPSRRGEGGMISESIIDTHLWPCVKQPASGPVGFPGGSDGKESACNTADLGLIPGWGRALEEWNGYPLQYSCLENPMDREAWRAIVHEAAKSQTQLSD